MHYHECRRLTENPLWTPSTLPRLIAKVLLTIKADRRTGRTLDDLMPSYSTSSTLPLSFDEIALAQDVFRLLGTYEKIDKDRDRYTLDLVDYGMWEEEDFFILVRKILSCTVTLYDASANPVGVGVSPGLSRIRHSCKPNCQVIFPLSPVGKNAMRLVATSSIQPGEEITLSYVDLCLPIHLRHEALEVFAFDHSTCSTCSNIPVDPRWTALHASCLKGGHIPLSSRQRSVEVKDGRLVEYETCLKCLKRVSIRRLIRTYDHFTENAKTIWDKERGGVLAHSLRPTESSITKEIRTLKSLITTILETHPAETYPIPHLQVRLGRLCRMLPMNMDRLLDALGQFKEAYQSIHRLNDEIPNPTTCQLGIELSGIYLDMVKMFKTDYQDTLRVPVDEHHCEEDESDEPPCDDEPSSDEQVENLIQVLGDDPDTDPNQNGKTPPLGTEPPNGPVREQWPPDDEEDVDDELEEFREFVDSWVFEFENTHMHQEDRQHESTGRLDNIVENQDVVKKYLTEGCKDSGTMLKQGHSHPMKPMKPGNGNGIASRPLRGNRLITAKPGECTRDQWMEDNHKRVLSFSRQGRIWIERSRGHLKALGYEDDHPSFRLLESREREVDELEIWFEYEV
ncbi:uncharacterized protein I303_104793 [Kwoniella dejecticola CBS 10117]|uniref:SET domain-containing protein n=1 Tax=Kwoniella dejecticola CBS 10117 TaxID=1296121 RepID=A0A1A6A4C2_9TREE|nr:uncharacterized protein I303_04226 [Kwoniella dejecticola CBS 10117]OBR84904.1 hypothetical protein I303_04226 [Kwoniella dejecticola CBS 10117]